MQTNPADTDFGAKTIKIEYPIRSGTACPVYSAGEAAGRDVLDSDVQPLSLIKENTRD